MTELDLYKFIQEWNPEWIWQENHKTKLDDVLIWFSIVYFDDFYKLLPETLFEEGGISCRIVSGSVAIWASDFCDSLGIDYRNVFPKE